MYYIVNLLSFLFWKKTQKFNLNVVISPLFMWDKCLRLSGEQKKDWGLDI